MNPELNNYTDIMAQTIKLARDEAKLRLEPLLAKDIANSSDMSWINKVGDAVGDTFNKVINGDFEGEKVFGREITEGKVQDMLSMVEQNYLSGRINLDISELNIIDKQSINYLKDYNFEAIQRLSDDTRDGIKGSLMQSAALGEDLDTTTARIRNFIDEPFPVYRKADMELVEQGKKSIDEVQAIRFIDPDERSRMIAKTETMRSYNEGNVQRYKDSGVKKLDADHQEGECPTCADIVDMAPYDINDPELPIWPQHPWCQHEWRPYIDDLAEEARNLISELEEMGYESSVGSPPSDNNFDFMGQWSKQDKQDIFDAINMLPDHLRNQTILDDGLIGRFQAGDLERVDGRFIKLGTELQGPELQSAFLQTYAEPLAPRYADDIVSLGLSREEFMSEFANYAMGEKQTGMLGDFFKKEVYREKDILAKEIQPIMKTSLGVGEGMTKPVKFSDQNGVEWYAKKVTEREAQYEIAGQQIAEQIDLPTYSNVKYFSEDIVAKTNPELHTLLSENPQQLTNKVLFTENIPNAQSVGEFIQTTNETYANVISEHYDDMKKTLLKDYIIGNPDGHPGNYLIGNERIYAIDNSMGGYHPLNNFDMKILRQGGFEEVAGRMANFNQAGFDKLFEKEFGDLIRTARNMDLTQIPEIAKSFVTQRLFTLEDGFKEFIKMRASYL